MFFLLVPAAHAEESHTVKIYPTDDGVTYLYDSDRQTDWSTARNYSDALTNDAVLDTTITKVRSDKHSGWYRFYRSSMLFDVSDIPEDATIVSATLNVYKEAGANNHGNTDIVFTEHNRLSTSTLTREDWYISNYGTELARGLLQDNQYTTYILNSAGLDYLGSGNEIIIGGLTEYDYDDVEVGAVQTSASFYSLDAEGTSTDPYLEVTYTLPDEERKVPLITQVVSPYPSVAETESWADNTYANGVAADSCGTTIAKCGCALASLVMLAQNYGITHGIDGSVVNPGNLNSWLTANAGYSADGGVIWDYAMQYFGQVIGYSKILFDRHNESSPAIINSYVADNQPAIAFKEVNGHYFLLTDILNSGQYSINDPFWYNTETTDDTRDVAGKVQSYGGSIDHANLFSYHETEQQLPKWVEIHLGSPAELLVTDSQGRQAGYDPTTGQTVLDIPNSSYSKEGIGNPFDEDKPVHLEKVLIIQPAEDDTYDLQVIGTGTGSYNLTVARNKGMGEYSTDYFTGSTTPTDVDTYVIDDSGVHKTIEELYDDLKELIRATSLPSYRQHILLTLTENSEHIDKREHKYWAKLPNVSLDQLSRHVALYERRGWLTADEASEMQGIITQIKDLIAADKEEDTDNCEHIWNKWLPGNECNTDEGEEHNTWNSWLKR